MSHWKLTIYRILSTKIGKCQKQGFLKLAKKYTSIANEKHSWKGNCQLRKLLWLYSCEISLLREPKSKPQSIGVWKIWNTDFT